MRRRRSSPRGAGRLLPPKLKPKQPLPSRRLKPSVEKKLLLRPLKKQKKHQPRSLRSSKLAISKYILSDFYTFSLGLEEGRLPRRLPIRPSLTWRT